MSQKRNYSKNQVEINIENTFKLFYKEKTKSQKLRNVAKEGLGEKTLTLKEERLKLMS